MYGGPQFNKVFCIVSYRNICSIYELLHRIALNVTGVPNNVARRCIMINIF